MSTFEKDKKLKIAIIGVGPIGGILGAHLAKSGEHVILVDILKDHLNAIKNNGLNVSGVVDMNARFEHFCYSVSELGRHEFDVVFISVKASVLKYILPELERVYRPGAKFVSLQNGLDTEEYIAETFGAENTLRVVVNYAGNLISDGNVRMSFFNGPNYIGALSPEGAATARELAKIMSSADLDTEYTEDIKKYEWEKTILNAALSPVCALTRKTMKEMMDFDKSRFLVEELLKEGIAVAKAQGTEFGDDFLEHCMVYLDNAGYHKTSMHVDIENSRMTEIGFLNEKIVHYGLMHNVPTPYNTTITNLIRSTERPSDAR